MFLFISPPETLDGASSSKLVNLLQLNKLMHIAFKRGIFTHLTILFVLSSCIIVSILLKQWMNKILIFAIQPSVALLYSMS